MLGNDRDRLSYYRTINLKIPLSSFFFVFLLQHKEPETKLHAETLAKLGHKDPTKNNISPKQNDHLHFLISKENDVEVDDRKKDTV